MPSTYRRPGVYLEESLLLNPSDVAGTTTVAAFVGLAAKGPVNTPLLVESWSDFYTVYGGFDAVPAPAGTDPLNLTSTAFPAGAPTNFTTLQAHATKGNGKYVGPPNFNLPGEFVRLGDNSKAYYNLPALVTNRATAAPGQAFAADPDITAQDAANAAKLLSVNEVQTLTKSGTISGGTWTATLLGNTTAAIQWDATSAQVKAAIDTAIPGNTITVAGGPIATTPFTVTFGGGTYGDVSPIVVNVASLTGTTPGITVATTTQGVAGEGYVALPQTAWTSGQVIWIGSYAFSWSGTAWAAGPQSGTIGANNGVWASGVYPGTVTTTAAPKALSYLPFAVYSFFQNGGRFAWIVRAAKATTSGTFGATATVNVTDGAATPLTAFKINAISAGDWGNKIAYRLGVNVNEPKAFSLEILQRADGVNYETLERFQNLSVRGEIAGTRRVDSAVNDSLGGSRYVRITGLNLNIETPVEKLDAVLLAGGNDPDWPTASDLQTAPMNLGGVEGPIVVNICSYLNDETFRDRPGELSDGGSVLVGANFSPSSFSDREDIMIFNDFAQPKDYTVSYQTSSYAVEMKNDLVYDQTSYTASYGPWILIPHPTQVGAVIPVPPGGAVLGVMARIDATIGFHRAPAGVIATLTNAVGVQAKFTDTELGDLNHADVNVIRPVVGAGICVMGARTRKSYGPDHYISARRTLINIKEQLRRSTQYAVFENNDERLWSSLRITADNILRPLWERGGLRGTSPNQAYYIRCDSTINTINVISSGEVRMEIGVALEYPAEFVVIKITQITSSQFTNEVQAFS
jgi:phage tail sheath protein FI